MEDATAVGMRILRRLPPTQVEKGLAGLSRLMSSPELLDQLHQRADKPLLVSTCAVTNSPYLQCEFNRDGDSFRSPWSNEFQPALPSAAKPPDYLRNLEIQANERFEEYKRLCASLRYFEGGISSVYLWETASPNFAGCFLVKRGTWESTHLVTVSFDTAAKQITYKMTSTLFLMLELGSASIGDLALNGSLNRALTKTQGYVKEPYGDHLVYGMIGLVEEMEKALRSDIEMIYIGKSQEIMNKTRHVDGGTSQRYRIYQ